MHRATSDPVWLGVLILTPGVGVPAGPVCPAIPLRFRLGLSAGVGSGRSGWCQGGLEQLGPLLYVSRCVVTDQHPVALPPSVPVKASVPFSGYRYHAVFTDGPL